MKSVRALSKWKGRDCVYTAMPGLPRPTFSLWPHKSNRTLTAYLWTSKTISLDESLAILREMKYLRDIGVYRYPLKVWLSQTKCLDTLIFSAPGCDIVAGELGVRVQ
jgi:hypothetical protein